MPATVNIAPVVAVAMSTPPVVHETGRENPSEEVRPPISHVLVEQN